MPDEHITVPSLFTKQGDHEFFAFSMKARELWDFVEINQHEMDKDTGYQRTLSESRVTAIAKYVDDGNVIPNAILITFTEDSEPAYDTETGLLRIPKSPGAGWVIDGQHRLAGARRAERDIELFVIAFRHLNLKEQIQQFVTINREAKGVPTSLYYDLLRQLPPSKTSAQVGKERAADISRRLREDPASVFFNRTVISNPKRGQISLNNFVRKVAPLVTSPKGKFCLYTFEEQTGIIHNYFKALENVFPGEFGEKRMRFLGTLGFGAILNVLPTVFDVAIKNKGGFRVEDAVGILTVIEDFEFTAWDQLGTGSQAEIQAGEDLRQSLLMRLEQREEPGSLRL